MSIRKCHKSLRIDSQKKEIKNSSTNSLKLLDQLQLLDRVSALRL